MLAYIQDLLSTQPTSVITLVAGTMLLAGFIRGFVGFGASLIIVMAEIETTRPVAILLSASGKV